MAVAATTIVKLFCDCVERGGDRTALYLPNSPNSATFHTLSWDQLSKEVRRLAAGLRRAGIKPGDRIVQVSENRYEWILLDLAVHLARGVHVALHASLSGQQIAWQIADSGAKIVVLSTASQIKKLVAEGIALPHGLNIIRMNTSKMKSAGNRSHRLPNCLPELARTRSTSLPGRQSSKPDPMIWQRFCTPRAQPAKPKA